MNFSSNLLTSIQKWPLTFPAAPDLLAVAKDTEDVQEEIDDVEIEVDGSVYVFLRGDLVHDHVGVEYNEEGGASDRDRKVHDRTREENLRRRWRGSSVSCRKLQ